MIKRIFDISVSLVAILFLCPLFIAVSMAIAFDSKGSILFRQERVGLNGKIFKISKFRTMAVTIDSEKDPKITMALDSRITKVGSILRRYKIDELPQLFDVLIGKMSLVGPRPEVAYYVNSYAEEDKQIILSVKPGITDYASLHFKEESKLFVDRENLDEFYIKEVLPIKLKLNRKYIAKKGLITDLSIILATIYAIVFKQ